MRAAATGLVLSIFVTAIWTSARGGPAAAAAPACTCNSAAVVAQALPAVVNIRVVKVVRVRGATASKLEVDKFKLYGGSGFAIDPSGVIATNKHVIQDAAAIRVIFSDGTHAAARLIDAASLMDFALLKVDVAKPLAVLRFGDSDALQVAEPVIAIGNPLGLGTSVSTGVVSALSRNRNSTPFDDFIQTDAAINPGTSGGPLLDCAGKVIGITTLLISNSAVLGSIGLGFALPSNSARFAVGQLLSQQVSWPNWIGVHVQDLTPVLGSVFGYPTTSGAIVTRTDPHSPAAAAPLHAGDIISAVNGRQLHHASEFMRLVAMQSPGTPITLSVWQADHHVEYLIRGQPWPSIAAQRSAVLASAAKIARAQKAGLGLRVTWLTEAYRRRHGLSAGAGVLIDHVTPGSQANNAGLEAGQVIEQIDDEPVMTPQSVTKQLDHAGKPVALLVRGKTDSRWVLLFVGRIDVRDLLAPVPPLAPAGKPGRDDYKSKSNMSDRTLDVHTNPLD